MAIITKDNYRIINYVALGDQIHFTDSIKYQVETRFLKGLTGAQNSTIFTYLGVDKYEFCKEAYGYTPYDGGFPESKTDDYEALTRVIKAIFAKLEELDIPKTITRDNYKEVKCLRRGDTIEFSNGLEYEVRIDHLANKAIGGSNEEIFNYLGIEGKYSFCAKYYEYPTCSGVFPSCEDEDYPALTRVMKALFDKIIEKEDPFTDVAETVQKVCKEAIEDYYDNVKIIISNSVNINIKL